MGFYFFPFADRTAIVERDFSVFGRSKAELASQDSDASGLAERYCSSGASDLAHGVMEGEAVGRVIGRVRPEKATSLT